MSFIDQISSVLTQYANGQNPTDPHQAQNHDDQIAGCRPKNVLGSLILPALATLGTDQVRQRIVSSTTQMNPNQRGQFVQTLLNGLTTSGLSASSLLDLLGIDRTVETNPQPQATPDDAATLAAHAHATRPDVFNDAMQFYADHPAVVKAMRAVAMTAIAQHLSTRYAPQSR